MNRKNGITPVSFNPVKKSIKFKQSKKRNRIITTDEIDKIRQGLEVTYKYLLPIFEYSLKNPSRIGDLRKLTKKHLHESQQTVHYNSSKKKVDVTHITTYPEINEYFQKQLPEDCEYLFFRKIEHQDGTYDYTPIGNFKRAWNKVKKEANIKDLRWHDLRHHAATYLLDEVGMQTDEVMAIGGWITRWMLEVYHNADHNKSIRTAIEKLHKKKLVANNI